jgi:2-phospho-L-lactate/phosphoenolpyruvate guanylyltransferase
MTDSAGFSWTVLLPVKVLARAKSRLAAVAGGRRGELALALACDTVAAVAACPEVARVVVITSDPVAGPLLAALGAVIVPDEPGAPGPAEPGSPSADGAQEPLNAALRHGAGVAALRWPGTGLAALTADLPALRPAELAVALRAARSRPAFVPDAAGIGTTLYAVPPGRDFRPQFGGASRARHAATGAAELGSENLPGLRRDVDTADDLRAALAIGAGPRTTALAAEILADV